MAGSKGSMGKDRTGKGRTWLIQGLPLAAALGAALLPLQRLGQQFVILIVLLWVQVFFIVECYLIGR